MLKGKTISAHVAEATIQKIDQLAQLENRTRSQLTGTFVELAGDLPHEAWATSNPKPLTSAGRVATTQYSMRFCGTIHKFCPLFFKVLIAIKAS
ncbi:MAG: hypothetical protein VKJ02_00890 [Snowella sp.]|nr:hypothetical protein [Snowella sp.]